MKKINVMIRGQLTIDILDNEWPLQMVINYGLCTAGGGGGVIILKDLGGGGGGGVKYVLHETGSNVK